MVELKKLDASKYFCIGDYSKIENVPYTLVIDNGIAKDAKYTFLMPTFQRSKDLALALNSVIEQKTELSFNIIVVDNNPERNDETERLMQRNYNNVKHLRYYKNVENLGMMGNWNRLFQLCETTYGILFHDDDVLFNYFLTYMDEILGKHPELSAINSKTIDWDGKSAMDIPPFVHPKYMTMQTVANNYFSFRAQAPTGMLFKTKDVRSLGGFNESAYPSSDYAFILSLCLRGLKVAKTSEPLMLYRIANNASSKKETQLKWLYCETEMKKELARLVSANYLLHRLDLALDIKIRLRALKKTHHHYMSYEGFTPASKLFVAFMKVVYSIIDCYDWVFCRKHV